MVNPRVLAPLALLAGLTLAPTASAAGRAQEVTWHGNQIKMYAAQPAGRSGSGVIVAVIDGWVDRAHPDFEGRALAGADCTSGTCVAGQTRDGCTHGTHVAGTVGSSSFGVAPKATILPVRVLADDGKNGCTGTASNVAAGIRWATSHGAKVENLSLGPGVTGVNSSSDISTAVTEAAQAGVVVVFSAGNQDLPVAQSYGNDALVVAATGPSGQLASYSQRGVGVSVAAPGGDPTNGNCTQATCVTSLYPDNQYAVAAGTSMAAPHVSGMAALLLGQTPGRSQQNVRDRITSTAHPLSGAGAGLVDASAALGVSGTPRPAPAPSHVPVIVTKTHQPSAVHVAPKPTVKHTAAPPVVKKPQSVNTPLPSASPTASPTPSIAEPPATAAQPLLSPKDKVPLPAEVAALALLALAATGVIVTALRQRAASQST